MQRLITFALIFAFVSPCLCVDYNVIDFGAKGDGKTDDSQAFLRAWQSTCGAKEMATLVIPPNYQFLLTPLILKGPCQASNIHIQIKGKIVAPAKNKWISYYFSWILITNVNGLTVDGSEGSIHGLGDTWWSCKSCQRPSVITFNACNDLSVSYLNIVDSPRSHINVNGDDCIAISGNSSYVNVTGIACGPGHGISFTGTTNGARIKSFPNGPGYARAITFEQITLRKAGNPIIIDQFYYAPLTWGRVEVSGITFRDFSGTCAYDKAITLNCGAQGCFNITLDQINIVSSEGGKAVYCSGKNVHGIATSTNPTCSCLSS
ncbi:hypothetical protein V8G54_010396 [Vigna mungo]|uniref:Polygalacturonase n=1 Tax=Vigna mungo TaxID=3915 RepID=A0AAQ3NWL3_VIGMU